MTAIAGVDGSGFRQIIPAADPTSEKEISELLEISLNEHRRRLFNPRLSLKLRSALMYRIPAPKKKGGGAVLLLEAVYYYYRCVASWGPRGWCWGHGEKVVQSRTGPSKRIPGGLGFVGL